MDVTKNLTSRFLLDIPLMFAANNRNQRMAPDSGLHPWLPPSPCSPISSSARFKDEGEWVGGRVGGGTTVEEDESGVEISLAQHLCFHPSTFNTPLLSSPLPSQKKTLFLLPALVHPLIPRYSTAYVS